MRYLLILLAILMPATLIAETFPALYAVTGVEEDDVLNVRGAPDVSSAVIAELAPDSTDIEVVALDETERWGWINSSEQSGWVAMRFMRRQLSPGNSLLPRPLICFGTEPFWNLDIENGPIIELGWLGDTPLRFFGLSITSSANSPDHFALIAESRGRTMNAIVQRQICTDGMSDRVYGFGMSIVVNGLDEPLFYSGCCSLTR